MCLFSIAYFLDTYSLIFFGKSIFALSDNLQNYFNTKNVVICLFSASIFYAFLLPYTKGLLELIFSSIRFKLMSDKDLKQLSANDVKDYICTGEYKIKAIKLHNKLAYRDYESLRKKIDDLNNFEYAAYSIFIFYVIRIVLFINGSQNSLVEMFCLFFFDSLRYELVIFLNIALFVSAFIVLFPKLIEYNRNSYLKEGKKSLEALE